MKTRNDFLYEKFMFDSNSIEGENRLNPGDLEAVKVALAGIATLSDILNIHRILGAYLNKDWVGKLRTCDVNVGGYTAPSWKTLHASMAGYVARMRWLKSWRAHNIFEEIHPFQDLNGRTGRLIWLSKAVKEGYNFKISFLHEYYYQTLGLQRWS